MPFEATKQGILLGLELEFALGTLSPYRTPPPTLPTNTKTQFVPLSANTTPGQKLTPEQLLGLTPEYVIQDMVALLRSAGILAFPDWEFVPAAGGAWNVGMDISVCGPDSTTYGEGEGLEEGEEYTWVGMEVRSPPMAPTPASLASIRQVCALLRSRYRVSTNITTGLHVHVSGGMDAVLSFGTMRKLFAFLWVFEPQLDTLHPAHRQASAYCKSLRVASLLSEECYAKYGVVRGVLGAVAEIWATADQRRLCEMMTRPRGMKDKNVRVNAVPAREWLLVRSGSDDGEEATYPTVEFREHKGTLDGGEICRWVAVLVSIVEYCERTCEVEIFDFVIGVAKREEWSKTGDCERDAELAMRYGPVIAEGEFTVLHMLAHIGADKLAEYYKHNLYPLEGRGPREGVRAASGKEIVWKYESEGERVRLGEGAWKLMQARRWAWEALQAIVVASQDLSNGAETNWFEPGHRMWPEHGFVDVLPIY